MDSSPPIDTSPFLDPDARDKVVVRGGDALTYLQSQISQDILQLAVGDEAWTLVLEPTGKVCALARIARSVDDEFVLDTDAGFGELLAQRLRRFMIRVDAEITEVSAPSDAPRAAFEDQRIEAGWPRMGHEIIPGETIPAATGVTAVAVNFTKGCYPGQELVERMDSRGADAPWALRVVTIGADVPSDVNAGDAISSADGTRIGSITSVGSTHALAVVKRGHVVGASPITPNF